MMNLRDNATAPSRTTARIPTASCDDLEAWLYLPEGDGPHPAVVMAHGIGAIKASRVQSSPYQKWSERWDRFARDCAA